MGTAFGLPAFICAIAGRSIRAGVQAGIWTAIMMMPLGFAVGLVEEMRKFADTGLWKFAGDVVDAGYSFGFGFMLLLATPIMGFPLAAIGAVVGQLLRAIPLPTRIPPRTPA